MSLIQGTIITFSILPFFPFLIVFAVCRYLLKMEKKKSLLISMDITTAFLILSVAALFNVIFASRFGFYLILLLLLLALGLIGGAQNRIKGKVDGKRLCRAVWRLTFIAMTL
ncbi:DUF3397 family protein, partial [Paenibacillus sp. 28ISP30-2]|nr:DUF3397 family protein [Paenibacillus sp. 28ISP30-2]